MKLFSIYHGNYWKKKCHRILEIQNATGKCNLFLRSETDRMWTILFPARCNLLHREMHKHERLFRLKLRRRVSGREGKKYIIPPFFTIFHKNRLYIKIGWYVYCYLRTSFNFKTSMKKNKGSIKIRLNQP